MVYFKCHNVKQRLAMLRFLFDLGYLWHRDEDDYNDEWEVEEEYEFADYPIIVITKDVSIEGRTGENMAPTSCLPIMEFCDKAKIMAGYGIEQ